MPQAIDLAAGIMRGTMNTMKEPGRGRWISDKDPAAAGLRRAVHAGDTGTIQELLRAEPALATARLGSTPSAEQASQAFWHARAAGQRRAARVPSVPRRRSG